MYVHICLYIQQYILGNIYVCIYYIYYNIYLTLWLSCWFEYKFTTIAGQDGAVIVFCVAVMDVSGNSAHLLAGHYGKDAYRSGGPDLHNFISSGFVTLGRGHTKGTVETIFY